MAEKVIRNKTKYPNVYFNEATKKYDVKYNYKVYDIKTKKNKYKSKWVYNINTITEARMSLAELQSQGLKNDDKDITLEGALELWKLKAVAQDYSIVSQRNTEQQYNMIIQFLDKNTKIKDIDEDTYYTFFSKCREYGYSDETLHSINSCFRKLINLTYKKRLINDNPLHRSDNVKTTTKATKIDDFRLITKDEWRKLDSYFAKTKFVRLGVDRYVKFRFMYNLLYYTGVRIGECLALTYADFEEYNYYSEEDIQPLRLTESSADDMHLQGVRLKVTKSYVSEFKLTKVPKNIKERKIPVPTTLERLYYNELNWHTSRGGKITDRIFTYDYGTALSIITRACNLLEIPHISPHSFRHTYITNLICNGVPLPVIEKVSGDTQETILKRYSHMFENDERLVLKVMEKM